MSLLGNLFGKVETTVAEVSSDGSVVRVVHEGNSDTNGKFTDLVFGMFSFKNQTMKEMQDEVTAIGRGKGRNPVNGHVMYDGLEYNPEVGWVAPEGQPSAPPYQAAQDYQGTIPIDY